MKSIVRVAVGILLPLSVVIVPAAILTSTVTANAFTAPCSVTNPDGYTTDVDQAVTMDVLANDSACTVATLGDPGITTVVLPTLQTWDNPAAPNDTSLLQVGQQIKFTPAPGFIGTAKFSYEECQDVTFIAGYSGPAQNVIDGKVCGLFADVTIDVVDPATSTTATTATTTKATVLAGTAQNTTATSAQVLADELANTGLDGSIVPAGASLIAGGSAIVLYTRRRRFKR